MGKEAPTIADLCERLRDEVSDGSLKGAIVISALPLLPQAGAMRRLYLAGVMPFPAVGRP